MPQLTVRGIDPNHMKNISGALLEELAGICECGKDNFTIDCLDVTSVFEGETVATFPFIEVAWFDRGASVRNRAAEAITRHVREGEAGIAEVEVAFKVYSEEAYYINGRSCM